MDILAKHTGKMGAMSYQKELLKQFWSFFGGNKMDGEEYDRLLKLEKVKWIDEFKIIYQHQSPLKIRRESFDKRKYKLHKFSYYKNCFICQNNSEIRHHLISLSKGGVNSKKNTISLCRKCHSDIHPWLKNPSMK